MKLNNKYKITLALFFTRGISLETWVNQGLFDREKLIYEEHLKQGNLIKVYWLTYGSNDKELANKLKEENRLHKDIEVIAMPKYFNIPKIGSFLYSFFLPFICKKELKESDILKTNQMDGSWSAIIAKKLYDKPLLLRTGYTWSKLKYILEPNNKIKHKIIEFIEKVVYKNCDSAIIASENNKRYLINKYNISNNKLNVIYNYVDLNKFYDQKLKRDEKSIVFIGRLSSVKNIFNLIKACDIVKLNLLIYGHGELKEDIENFIERNKYNAKLMGTVSNDKIPDILNKSKYYALVSYQEGMPKTLIEAMSCGSVCIGTNTDGINELIKDEYNGILSYGFNDLDLVVALNKALEIDVKKIQKNAIKFARDNFDINKIVHFEYDLIKDILN